MGCGLRKIRQTDDSSPGKIYSTLKRPQVETKTGVSYTYCHLDFLVGKEDGTSTLCLSSVRELPSQLQDLYQQGFVLTAVHPFVHPCGPEPASVQRQLYRAVLTKLPESPEKSPADFEPYHLKLEECLSADHIPTTEHIQGYVKKIQDAADQGIVFAGFIQEPSGLRRRASGRVDAGELSLSLHSSPSSLRGSELTASPSHQGDPEQVAESGPEDWSSQTEAEDLKDSGDRGGDALSDGMSITLTPEHRDGQKTTPVHNNKSKDTEPASKPSLAKSGAELFGLFNYPGGQRCPLKYYTVKVPLKVHQREEGSCGVEAHWLDHMTQHFNSGASLVDGYFHLGEDNDQLPKVIDSVFIFQEGDPNTNTTYDAIVVEQWTVTDGIQVKTDYIPLLQSLASFGWKLTCVLPTPIVKTNSDGSLSTKQIVFLQRPSLPLKGKQTKKLIFKTRNKSTKNSIKDAPKNKKKKGTAAEKELDEPPKVQDGAGMDVADKDSKKKGKNEGRVRENEDVKAGEESEEGIERNREVSRELETKIDREERDVEEKHEGSEGMKGPDSSAEVKKEEMGNEEGGSDLNREMKMVDLPGEDRTEQENLQQYPQSVEESEGLAESDI